MATRLTRGDWTLPSVLLLGLTGTACNQVGEPPSDGFRINKLSSEKGIVGNYRHKGARYDFSSFYQGGLLEATVLRDGQQLVRLSRRDGQMPVVLIKGHRTEKRNTGALLEETSGPIVDFAHSEDAQALKLLALESSCLPGGAQLRMERQALQMPLLELQRYGLEVKPEDLQALNGRCNMKCNSLTPGADLFVTCGGAVGRVRPVNQVVDIATGVTTTYLDSANCFGACGLGCIGCEKRLDCRDGQGQATYNCYTRECCEKHDACLEANNVIGDMACHAKALPAGCTPVTALGADPGDPTNRRIEFVYEDANGCRPPQPDPGPIGPAPWEKDDRPDRDPNGDCRCLGFRVSCDSLCPPEYY